MVIPLKLLVVYLLLELSSNFAKAQYFTGPTASSMGGAGVASSDASETVFLNPASIAHAPDFEAGAFYKEGYLTNTEQNRRDLGLSFVDNSKGILVPGALSYFKSRAGAVGGPSAEAQLWQAAIGFFILRNLSLGVSLYRLQQNIDQGAEHIQWNSSVGVTYAASRNLGFGFAYYNFVKRPGGIPLFLRQLPGWRFGVNYGFSDILRLRADLQMHLEENQEQRAQILYGMEVKSLKFLSLRVGHRLDDVNKLSFVTAGIGFDGPRLKMNYSFEKNTRGNFGAMHGVDIRIPVW